MLSNKAVRKENPNDFSKPKLWTARVCPFSERIRLAMVEFGIEYDTNEIHLYCRFPPDDFLDVNPNGVVPVLEDKGYAIYESSICLEYIDETWHVPGRPGLLPDHAGDRAIARIWCDFISKQVLPPFYNMLLTKDVLQQELDKEKLLTAIKTVNDAMISLSPKGQFFFGNSLGFVDIMLAPFVERFVLLKHFRQFSVPENDDFERFHVWWDTIQKQSSFQMTRMTDEEIIIVYCEFAEKLLFPY